MSYISFFNLMAKFRISGSARLNLVVHLFNSFYCGGLVCNCLAKLFEMLEIIQSSFFLFLRLIFNDMK